MPTDYTNDNYPSLPSKKARVEESDNTVETIDSSEQSDTVIIDLEAELTKERAHTEERISALHRALAEEIDKMKKEFNTQIQNSIEQSEKRMTSAIQEHISDIMKSSDNAINRIEKKANEVADQLLGIMQNRNTLANETNATPRRKNQRHDHDDVDMQEDEGTTNVQVTPASHESRSQYGTDKMASERK
jgi:transcriptional regulator